MPDAPTTEDPRSPTPHPEGLSDEEFEKFMKGIEETLPQNLPQRPATSSVPLTVESALEAQKKKNTGITSAPAALRNEAAKRAMAAPKKKPSGAED